MGLTASGDRFEALAKDWRNGAVVYQVFVDRFVPPTDLSRRAGLYPTPLKKWSDLPKPSAFDPAIQGYPHCYEFWGGDLAGVRTKLDYVRDLGADVLYLQPIFRSGSNHKYDTDDYHAIDPQYGTMDDLRGLISDTHKSGMKLMLDGVFNHIGLSSPLFQEALTNPKSKHRDWFFIGKQYKEGYRSWSGVKTMPGWRLESAAARDYLENAAKRF